MGKSPRSIKRPTKSLSLQIQKYIAHYLAWLLGMKRPGYDLTWYNIRHRWSSVVNQMKTVTPHANGFSLSHSNINMKNPQFQLNSAPKIVISSYETKIIYSELRTIISQLQMITDYIWQQEKYDNEAQDWKFVAMVIDRLCLYLSIVLIIIFTIFIFLPTSKLYHVH